MLETIKKLGFLFIAVILPVALSSAQKLPSTTDGHEWWKHAVLYEIYPRSFADSNNDGIGDLKGIDAHLDYLKDLGVDAIWITPCYPSPQVDFGYDVSDYENIDPMYGTLSDFEHLSMDAKTHNVRIIMDFVLNHTSRQHKWFLDSASSRNSAHRDWYIWRDGKAARHGNSIRKQISTITISLLSASQTSIGATPLSRMPCSTSRASGTNAASRDFGSMRWTYCSKIRNSTTIQFMMAKTISAILTWIISTTISCPRSTPS
jgi:hypothetical protein